MFIEFSLKKIIKVEKVKEYSSNTVPTYLIENDGLDREMLAEKDRK